MKRYYAHDYGEMREEESGEFVCYEDLIGLINDCLVLYPLPESCAHSDGWKAGLYKLMDMIEK
jgi:hypothetical protein